MQIWQEDPGRKQKVVLLSRLPQHVGQALAICRGTPWGALGQGKPSPYTTRLVAVPPRCATCFIYLSAIY